MTAGERHEEVKRLRDRLTAVRRGFLHIAEAMHEANSTFLSSDLPPEVDRLDRERRMLSSEYRRIVGRLQLLRAA